MPAINHPTIKFHTLGCKVNQYDTQSIRERFLEQGFREIQGRSTPADLYLINTCTVTASADQKSRGIIRRSINENPRAKVIVTGCLTELDEDQIRTIDSKILIVKNKDKDIIYELCQSRKCEPRTPPSAGGRCEGISDFQGHTRAFLKIQDGCDNFCSYCKVPLARGRSRSKPLKDLTREAVLLAEKGFQEIVLTGICLGAYGRDLTPKTSLVRAIGALEKIPGIIRIRLSSIEAGDVSAALINKMAGSGKLCRHLHIPIQSGDDEILKKMRRKYSRKYYINLIKKIKNKVPGASITTDCLIGFPGEGRKHFRSTLDLVKRILPLKVHIFPYSAREGTAAYLDPALHSLPPAEIKGRFEGLKSFAGFCSKNYKKRFFGKTLPVLFESRAKGGKGYWEGYTDNYIKVLFRSRRNLKNMLVRVRLKKIIGDYVLAAKG